MAGRDGQQEGWGWEQGSGRGRQQYGQGQGPGRGRQQYGQGQGSGRGRQQHGQGQGSGRGRQQHGQGQEQGGGQQWQGGQTRGPGGSFPQNTPQGGSGNPREGQGSEAKGVTMPHNVQQNTQTTTPPRVPTLGNVNTGVKTSWANIVAKSTQTTPSSSAAGTPRNDKDVASFSNMSLNLQPGQTTPGGSNTPRTKISEDTTIDPSNVLPNANRPSTSTTLNSDSETTSWLGYVKILCQNVFRVSRENDASYDQQCKQISNDLKIYQGYSQGRQAIFPARPPSPPNLRSGIEISGVTVTKVSANHFKMTLPSFSEIPQLDLASSSANLQTQFYLYSVVWPSESQGRKLLKDLKKVWWDEIVTIHGNDPKGMNKIYHVYDGGPMMIANAPFAWEEGEIKQGVTLLNGEKSVFIKFNEILDWKSCINFLSNNLDERNAFPNDAIRVLNMVMKEYCVKRGYFESGRYYFDKGNEKKLGNHGLLISRSGYFQSVRALQGGLTLNVDIMTSAFYKPNTPLQVAWDLFRSYYLPEAKRRSFDQWTNQSVWNEEQVGIANECWKNLQIGSSHRRELRGERKLNNDFTIYQIEENRADMTHVEGLYNTPFTGNLCQFMVENYNLNQDDLCGNMPAIKLSKRQEHYLPWGCCNTTFASRHAGPLEDTRLLKDLERDPHKRCDDILVWMQNRHRSHQDPISKLTTAENRFKISMEPIMMTIDGFRLAKPNMEARDTQLLRWSGDEPNRLNPNPTFTFTNHKFIDAGTVYPWGIISFDEENIAWQECFLEILQRKANELGIIWRDRYPNCKQTATRRHRQCSNEQRQRIVKDAVKKLMGMGPRLNLIICFMAHKMNPEYAALKAECDIVHGVPVQVVLTKKESDPNKIKMSIVNLLMKINVKCGGANFRVSQSKFTAGQTGCLNHISLTHENQSKKTILLGADVTHPRGICSIAAVVATTSSSFLNYATRIQSQASGEEIIQDLKAMVKDLLQVYQQKEGCWPQQILFFRDGVSETKYLDVLRYEGVRILEAAQEVANYKPQLTIILAVKRHHTRFFQTNKDGRWINISQGTVIDKGVTHPKDYDFFLCSQAPLKGTSRATHYYVLLDQINLGRADLYRLIYYLSHTYQRCTKSVSLVTPVYYSHLAAFRAKHYMENYLLEHKDRRRNYDLNAHKNLQDRLWFL